MKMGAGTDAHRVASYNPFTTLKWLLVDSKNTGAVHRGPEQSPTREDALRAYTIGSSWFSFDENKRGSLEPGKLADLAVLSKDYMTAPLDELSKYRIADDHGRRQNRLCSGTLCGTRECALSRSPWRML